MHVLLKTTSDFVLLRDLLARLFGMPLQETADELGRRCEIQCLDLEIIAVDNPGLEADAGIPYDEYSLQIDIVALRADCCRLTQTAMAEAVARHLAARATASFAAEARVLRSLQETLAIFRSGEPVLL